jgi:hypothetical protein
MKAMTLKVYLQVSQSHLKSDHLTQIYDKLLQNKHISEYYYSAVSDN